MADIFLTIDQLNRLFQNVVLSILGYDDAVVLWNEYQTTKSTWTDPIPPNPYYFVRVSWPTGGAPAWKITEDIAFLQVSEVDNPYNRQRDVNMLAVDANNAAQLTQFTRVMGISWVLYGPNSFENAQAIRDKMFYQRIHDVLAEQNIYLIPDITSPRRVPELFESQWWERVDLSMRFNEFIQRDLEVPYIKSSEITVSAGNGISSIIEIDTN